MIRVSVAFLICLLAAISGAAPVQANPLWTVTIHALDRAGQPITDGRTALSVWDLSTGAQAAYARLTSDIAIRVPSGRYSFHAVPISPDGSPTLVILAEVPVRRDTAVTLDARLGQPVSVSVDDKHAQQVIAVAYVYQRARNGRLIKYAASPIDPSDGLFVTPIAQRPDITLYIFTQWHRSNDFNAYHLVNEIHGRVPQRLAYHHRTADLAAVHVDYHAQGADACGGVYINPVLAGEPSAMSYGVNFPLPTTRIEYYVPSRDVTWETTFGQTRTDCSFEEEADVHFATPARYPHKGTYRTQWNTAPIAPASRGAFGQRPIAFRQDNTMSFLLPSYTDAENGHIDGGGPYSGVTGSANLSRNGQQLCRTTTVEPMSACAVPPDPGEYNLTLTASRKVSWSALSTTTETTWTFPSAPAPHNQPVPIPLTNVRYDIPLDAYNRAPAGPFTFVLHVDAAAAVDIAVSFDEGATWQPIQLEGFGAQRVARLNHPPQGTVSLLLKAADPTGASMTQKLISAYLIK